MHGGCPLVNGKMSECLTNKAQCDAMSSRLVSGSSQSPDSGVLKGTSLTTRDTWHSWDQAMRFLQLTSKLEKGLGAGACWCINDRHSGKKLGAEGKGF